jgi:hypothetical protein
MSYKFKLDIGGQAQVLDWPTAEGPSDDEMKQIVGQASAAPTRPMGPYGPYGPTGDPGFSPMGVSGMIQRGNAAGEVTTQPSARPSRSQKRRLRRKAAAQPTQAAQAPTEIGSTFTGGRSVGSLPGAVDDTAAQNFRQSALSNKVTRPDMIPPPQPSITERMQGTPGTLEHTMLSWNQNHPHAPAAMRENAKKAFAYRAGEVAKRQNEQREEEAKARYYAAAKRRGGLVPSLDSPAAASVSDPEMRKANEDYLQARALRSGFPAHPTVMESVGGAIGGFGKALAEAPGSLAVSATEELGRARGLPANWWAGRDEDAAKMTGGAQEFFGGPEGEQRAVDFATFWLPSAAMPIVIGQAASVVGHSMQTDPETGEPVGLMGATGEAIKGLAQSVDFYPELHGGAPISPGERAMRGLMAGMAVLGLAHAGLKGWDWWKARSTPDLVRMAADHGVTLQFRDAERLMSERDAAVHEQAGKLGTTPDAVEAEIAKAPKGKRPAKAAAAPAAAPEVLAEGTTLPAREVSGEGPAIETPGIKWHGTDAEFDTFDLNKSKAFGGSKFGHWFTGNEEFATAFGKRTIAAELTIDNPKTITSEQWNAIREAHARDGEWFAKWKQDLQAQGFDGLHVKGKPEMFAGYEMNPDDIWATFRDDQVKVVKPEGGITAPTLEGNPLSLDELRDIETRAPEMDEAARETHRKMLDEHRTIAETMGERIARICFGRGGGFSIE